MKAIIHRLPLTHLLNSEYSIFVTQIIAIFAKYQPDLLHLKKAYERLTAMVPQLVQIKAQEVGNSITSLLEQLDNERNILIKGIMYQIRMMGKLSVPDLSSYVLTMKRFMDLYGSEIVTGNYNAATERTNKLLAEYNAKVDLQDAVDALYLKMVFDQLTAVNSRFAKLFIQRTEQQASLEHVDIRAIRFEADKVLLALFDAFEFCSSEYEDLDFKTPAKEVNELIDYYKMLIKGRTSRRNAGKEIGNEATATKSMGKGF